MDGGRPMNERWRSVYGCVVGLGGAGWWGLGGGVLVVVGRKWWYLHP